MHEMRTFSSGPHAGFTDWHEPARVRPSHVSRIGPVLGLLAVLCAGVALGSWLPVVGDAPSPAPASTPQTTVTETRIPSEDVPGRDLGRLPRYPQSVRSEYGVTLEDRYRVTAVEFLATSELDDVRGFYEAVIRQHGWQRADVSFSAGEWTYVLVDGAIEALIELEISAGMVEIDLHVSEPLAPLTAPGTPSPPAAPTPRPPAVAPPDDDGEDGNDGDDEDDGSEADGDGATDD